MLANVGAATLTRLLTQPTSPIEGEVALHLSPGGRGRARMRAGEGGNTAFFLLSTEIRSTCRCRAATLTRPFGATSPIEGKVERRHRARKGNAALRREWNDIPS